MPRNVDTLPMDRTTVCGPALLLDRVGVHVKREGDTQNDFWTRAALNQLERERDLSIRSELKEMGYDV